jgi:GNAT superfamily N-acetyltransferase
MLFMAIAMHAESPRYRGLQLSRRKLSNIMERMHDHPELGALLVAEKDEEVIGMMWGYVDEFFFSEERYATDILLYVVTEHRGSRAAYQLVKAFEEWSYDKNARYVQPGVSTGIDNDGYARFYERMGYSVTGLNLSKTVM